MQLFIIITFLVNCGSHLLQFPILKKQQEAFYINSLTVNRFYRCLCTSGRELLRGMCVVKQGLTSNIVDLRVCYAKTVGEIGCWS